MFGAVRLKEASYWIHLTCSKCERRGRLKRDRLLGLYDPDTAMPDLLKELAKPCPRLD